jgi:ubiquinol-cytochrome c reductase cytochrome b subunit
LAGICLIIQILSGVFLTMNYKADILLAFSSIENIVRETNYG